MIYNYTAQHNGDETEFGGTVEAERDGDDYRPVFAAAHKVAVNQHGPDVTVTAISYNH